MHSIQMMNKHNKYTLKWHFAVIENKTCMAFSVCEIRIYFQSCSWSETWNFSMTQLCPFKTNVINLYKILLCRMTLTVTVIIFSDIIKTIHLLFFIDLTVILLSNGKYDPLTYLSWPFQKLCSLHYSLILRERSVHIIHLCILSG